MRVNTVFDIGARVTLRGDPKVFTVDKVLLEGFPLEQKYYLIGMPFPYGPEELFEAPEGDPEPDIESCWLKVKEVAELMNVSTRTVYKMIHEGTIPATWVGKTVRVHSKDIRV